MKGVTERLRRVEKANADRILAAIGANSQVGKRHQHCPFPDHEDRNPSFRYDPDSGLVFCTCLDRQGTSLTDALIKAQGLADFNSAVREIEAITGEKIFDDGSSGSESNQRRANNRKTVRARTGPTKKRRSARLTKARGCC